MKIDYPFVILDNGEPVIETFRDGTTVLLAFRELHIAKEFCKRDAKYSVAELVLRK